MVFCSNHDDGLILMAQNMNQKWKKFIEKENENENFLFNHYIFPDINPNNRNIKDTILGKIDNGILLKELIVSLIQEYGISYSETEYKKNIKELEQQEIIVVNREPFFSETGKKATSLDYDKYEIMIERKNNDTLF